MGGGVGVGVGEVWDETQCHTVDTTRDSLSTFQKSKFCFETRGRCPLRPPLIPI